MGVNRLGCREGHAKTRYAKQLAVYSGTVMLLPLQHVRLRQGLAQMAAQEYMGWS